MCIRDRKNTVAGNRPLANADTHIQKRTCRHRKDSFCLDHPKKNPGPDGTRPDRAKTNGIAGIPPAGIGSVRQSGAVPAAGRFVPGCRSGNYPAYSDPACKNHRDRHFHPLRPHTAGYIDLPLHRLVEVVHPKSTKDYRSIGGIAALLS